MKLLFDENLSPGLVRRLANLFPESAHMHGCRLGASDDEAIWRFAATHGFVIVSKDVDFHDRSVLRGSPPKLIWLRVGNCETARVEKLLRERATELQRFADNPEISLLILP